MLAMDHLVLAAINPQQAAREFSKKHALEVVEGGKHELWGTYNYLAYFSNNSYIEWLGIFDEEIAKRSTNPLIAQLVDRLSNHEEGFFQFALRTENMDEYIEHFKKQDLTFTGPISGSRQKPNGSLLEWSMLFPDQLPFLIEWGDTRNLPDDPRFINEQQLGFVQINNKYKQPFRETFLPLSEESSIKLANSTLYFSAKDAFDFQLI